MAEGKGNIEDWPPRNRHFCGDTVGVEILDAKDLVCPPGLSTLFVCMDSMFVCMDSICPA